VLAFQTRVAEELPDVLRVRVTVMVLVVPPPVTVIVALFVPTVAVLVFTLTVKLPLLDPDVGFTVIQLAFSLTVQDVLDVIVSV
jgi:hypothetical protein